MVTREFVNADEIARGLSPFNPEGAALAAGRLMLDRMSELVRRRESFIVETTGAGQSNLNFVRMCKAQGWTVGLMYLWLRSPTQRFAGLRDVFVRAATMFPPTQSNADTGRGSSTCVAIICLWRTSRSSTIIRMVIRH
jgi:hypothetical protein